MTFPACCALAARGAARRPRSEEGAPVHPGRNLRDDLAQRDHHPLKRRAVVLPAPGLPRPPSLRPTPGRAHRLPAPPRRRRPADGGDRSRGRPPLRVRTLSRRLLGRPGGAIPGARYWLRTASGPAGSALMTPRGGRPARESPPIRARRCRTREGPGRGSVLRADPAISAKAAPNQRESSLKGWVGRERLLRLEEHGFESPTGNVRIPPPTLPGGLARGLSAA